MTRAIVMLLASLLLAGAGPRSSLPPPPALPSLPLPPPLPADPPTDQAAPVPNGTLWGPDASAGDHGAFAFRIYRMPEFGTSQGFIPGSAYESPEQRRPMQPPGFSFTLPLQ